MFFSDMEKGAFSILSVTFIAELMILFPHVTLGEPRARVVQQICSHQTVDNSTVFVSNFVPAMENISQQIQTQGYGLEISGRGPNAVYAMAQCYGDLSLTDCALCYSTARTYGSQCFPANGGKTFLDGCFMRIGNTSFFQEYTGLEDRVVCENSTRRNSTFRETARRAVLQSASYAPNNNGYARVEIPVSGTNSDPAYVLANCWRTLSENSCRLCLEKASTSIIECLPRSGGRALNAGCFMRYSDSNFLNPVPSAESSRRSLSNVIEIVVCSIVVVIGVVTIGAYFWKRRSIQKKRKGSYDAKEMAKILRDSSLIFKYAILEKATGGFDEANKIGQGGFGAVYRGVLPDGREIAVKRLFFNNIHRIEEFCNEVNIISCLQHKNLVRLLGCCCSGVDSLLVYEYLPNKSLDQYIFGLNEEKILRWEEKFAIIIDIAEGLVYLHENPKIRVIHRDIKASNILLDLRLRAKIADFGLARSFLEDKSHISTALAGTLGYMAPEYLSHGMLTEKVDVYSFGILLLEIVTGRRNNESNTSDDYECLVTIAWNHFQMGTIEELIDPNLLFQDHYNASVKNDVQRVIHVGLLCIQEIPSLRPSMSEALQMLTKKDGDDEHLPPPTNPPFIEKTMELDGKFKNQAYPLNFGNLDSVASVSWSVFHPR